MVIGSEPESPFAAGMGARSRIVVSARVVEGERPTGRARGAPPVVATRRYCCRKASKRLIIASWFSTHQGTERKKPLPMFCGEFGRFAAISGVMMPVS
jgi:hypothetical protein